MKIAIYGGAFNPVHLGHIEIVKHLCENTDFDKIIVIPSKFSPHKSNKFLLDDEHRIKMCELAFCGFEKCEVSDIEIRRNKISYTVDTLTELKTIYPFDELFLVCGSDMFLSLFNWRKPEEIFKLVSIFAFKRDNENEDTINYQKTKLNEIGVNVELCNIEISPFSSTEVRESIKSNITFDKYLSKDVFEYILKNNLYR